MQDQFICEPIKPAAGTMDAGGMTRGEPGLPRKFTWRDEEYTVDEVLEKWKETSPCRGGGSERRGRSLCHRGTA